MFFIQNDPVLLLSLQCTNYLTKRFIFTRVFEVRFNVRLLLRFGPIKFGDYSKNLANYKFLLIFWTLRILLFHCLI